jgi:hypothetical protein
VEQRDEGYLPPEPSGPEPDVGGGQQQPQQPPPQPPPAGYSPPYGYPAQGYPPATAPGYPPQPPQPPQPPGWQPGYTPPGGYYWQPPPPQPDNSPAVVGFVLSMVSAGLWLFSAGLSSIVSIICAIIGIVYGRRGKQKVESGETTKHKDLAQGAVIVGWVMVGLATLSTIIWILVFVLAATSESFEEDLNNELDESQSSALRLGAAAVRVVARLVS